MAKTPQRPTVLTRKQLVGLEREQYLNRLLLIGTGLIVALVLGLVAWTWALEALIHPNQNVAIVEGTEIKGHEFQARARLNRRFLIDSYVQTYQEFLDYQPFFGDDPGFQQQYYTALVQITLQLDPIAGGEAAINQLVDEKLLELEAGEMEIEISAEQVENDLRTILGFFPDGSPTPPVIPTVASTSTLSPAQYAIVSPTPTASVTPTASSTSEASATPAEQTGTAEVTATAVATNPPAVSPTPTLSPTPYTLEGYQTLLADFYTGYQSDLGMGQEDIRDFIRATLLREAIRDQITADLPRTQEQVWARHILMPTEEEAQAVLDRLDGGEDWNDLAAELSTDESNAALGGDLGWFPMEAMVDPFGTVAFGLSIGEISEPVQTEFGWHIIQVLGHENRPLDQNGYEQLREQKMTEYIQSLREKYSWEIFDSWQAMAPDEPQIPPQFRLQ
ncbi:MAG: peptidylprolyl isomerase [Anaerolineales bacterium]